MVNDASVKWSARGPRATGVCGRSDVNTGFDLNNSAKYIHGKSAWASWMSFEFSVTDGEQECALGIALAMNACLGPH